jgi:hypothetical protein
MKLSCLETVLRVSGRFTSLTGASHPSSLVMLLPRGGEGKAVAKG